MAQRIEAPAAVIPAGTPISSPVLVDVGFPPGEVEEVEIVLPDGLAGAVGMGLAFAGQKIIPRLDSQWIIGNDEVIRWPLEGYPNSGKWAVIAYNLSNFAHTIYLRWLINEVHIAGSGLGGTPLPPLDLNAAGLTPAGQLPPSPIDLTLTGDTDTTTGSLTPEDGIDTDTGGTLPSEPDTPAPPTDEPPPVDTEPPTDETGPPDDQGDDGTGEPTDTDTPPDDSAGADTGDTGAPADASSGTGAPARKPVKPRKGKRPTAKRPRKTTPKRPARHKPPKRPAKHQSAHPAAGHGTATHHPKPNVATGRGVMTTHHPAAPAHKPAGAPAHHPGTGGAQAPTGAHAPPRPAPAHARPAPPAKSPSRPPAPAPPPSAPAYHPRPHATRPAPGSKGDAGAGPSSRSPLTAGRDGFTIAGWLAPYVDYARAHGWTGRVTSGYRSDAAQRIACQHVCGNPNGCPGRCAKPGTSNHRYLQYPHGAVDVSDPAGFTRALASCPYRPRIFNALPADPVHFSPTGT